MPVIDGTNNDDQLQGTAGDDTMRGFANYDWLVGSPGNDSLDGGTELDLVTYDTLAGSIIADLGAGVVTKSIGGTDTLVSIENIHGTAQADRLTLSAAGGYALGRAGNDTLIGVAGRDQFLPGSGNDSINGGDNYDWIDWQDDGFDSAGVSTAGVSVNVLAGSATDSWGNTDSFANVEEFRGTNRADTLRAGGDLGTLFIRLVGRDGNDTLDAGGNINVEIAYQSDPGAIIVDLAAGTARDGYGGTDQLLNVRRVQGGDFADTITGNATDNILSGGGGHDRVSGGAGNDTLRGAEGDDTLLGDGGDDVLGGDIGQDRMDGGAGNDRLEGDVGDDTLAGGDGVDTLIGGTGPDRFMLVLQTVPGRESPRGTPDVINDFAINDGDNLAIDTAADMAVRHLLYAGVVPGSFTALSADIALPAFTQPALFTASPVYWVAHATLGGWFVVDENRNGTLSSNETAIRLASSVADPAQVRLGGASVITQAGDNGANAIFITPWVPGTALGLGGDDTIYGGGGADNMIGGTGNDSYVVRNTLTTVRELAGEGHDVLWTDAWDVVLGANIEEGRLLGTAGRMHGAAGNEALVANGALASQLYGNGGDDVLWGGGFADTLDGGDGDDILRSQGGADVMLGGRGNDQAVVQAQGAVFVELAGQGSDTAWVAVNDWTMDANIEIARLAAPGAWKLTGSAGNEDMVANQSEASRLDGMGGNDVLWGSSFADTLNGGDGDDVMRGQGGADSMTGGAGDDQYVVFSAAASVIELANGGHDILYFAASGTLAFGDHVEEARLVADGTGLVGGANAELLVGNSSGLASNIRGGGGADTIFGTAAGDTLSGGAGNDTIYTGGGADRLLYDTMGFGFDQVANQGGSVVIQFAAGSGITSMAQLGLNAAGGNTQVTTAQGSILVFGATLTAGDFIFG